MTSVHRAGHSNWVIGTIAALAIFGLSVSVTVAVKESSDAAASSRQTKLTSAEQQRDIACIKAWVAKSNQRDAVVGHYAAVRSRTLGRVQLYQARHPRSNGPYLANLRLAYVVADRAYLDAEQHYPAPPFRCADLPPLKTPTLPPLKTPSITASSHARPRSAPRATVTRTVPVPVPGPTTTLYRGTRTVTAPPGKARTVTVTATVTASPSCVLGPVCIGPLGSP